MKTYKVKVNGKEYLVELEEVSANKTCANQEAAKVQKTANMAATNSQAELVKAPIQGSVFKILKNIGDTVEAGEAVMIIEAMKMENEIVAPKAGELADVFVTQGQQVDTNANLFSLI